MYINGLMDSKSDFNTTPCDRFLGGKNMIFFSIVFNSFHGSNKEKWVVTEGRRPIVKCSETSFDRGEIFENPIGLFHV